MIRSAGDYMFNAYDGTLATLSSKEVIYFSMTSILLCTFICFIFSVYCIFFNIKFHALGVKRP